MDKLKHSNPSLPLRAKRITTEIVIAAYVHFSVCLQFDVFKF